MCKTVKNRGKTMHTNITLQTNPTFGGAFATVKYLGKSEQIFAHEKLNRNPIHDLKTINVKNSADKIKIEDTKQTSKNEDIIIFDTIKDVLSALFKENNNINNRVTLTKQFKEKFREIVKYHFTEGLPAFNGETSFKYKEMFDSNGHKTMSIYMMPTKIEKGDIGLVYSKTV